MSYSLKKRDVPLYVMSDLHLGAGRRDNFSEPARVKQLRMFLEHIGNEGSQLVILGDFLDLWRFNLSAILTEHPEIIKLFSQIDCVYIPGNHDLGIGDVDEAARGRFDVFNKISEPFVFDIGGQKFVFCHGHEVDTLNRYINPSLGKLLGHSAIFVEHFARKQIFDSDNIRSVAYEIEAVIIELWLMMVLGVSRFVNDSLTIRRRTLDFLKKRHNIKTISKYEDYLDESHIIINAHTHKAGNFNNCYFNSGSWALGNSDFLRIIPDGAVEVLKWTAGGIVGNNASLA
jgi:UDP-2,3-diacylglucosamine pyrophosphatase LpxH